MKTPAFIFDLGGVLLDWNPRHLYRKLFPGDEPGMEHFLEEIQFNEWNHVQDAGRPFSVGVEELCARHPQHRGLIQAYHERFPESVSGAIPRTVEILRRVREGGYPLFALSNWSAETFDRVRPSFPFLDWFEGIVISGLVGAAKPDRRMFQALLDLVDRSAQECLFIDDSPANIAVAQEMGFQAILFQSPEQLAAELAALGLLPEI